MTVFHELISNFKVLCSYDIRITNFKKKIKTIVYLNKIELYSNGFTSAYHKKN